MKNVPYQSAVGSLMYAMLGHGPIYPIQWEQSVSIPRIQAEAIGEQ